MKLILQLHAYVSTLSFLSLSSVSAKVGLRNESHPSRRRLTKMDRPCLFLVREVQYEFPAKGKQKLFYDCLFQEDGIMVEIGGEGLDDLIKRSKNARSIRDRPMSGKSTIFLDGAPIEGDTLMLPVEQAVTVGSPLRQLPIGRRRLATTGSKKFLAVRVVAPDSETSQDESTLSDKLYGTNGDPVNLKTQYEACSYGAMTVDPYSGTTSTGVEIVGGVTTVEITTPVSGKRNEEVRDTLWAQAWTDLGDLQSQFDHVMFCLPPGTAGGWIAYAYVDFLLSIYNDKWCSSLTGGMHEIGHNLGLAHSDEDGIEYEDWSGIMGVSWIDDKAPKMCFNGVKSWQLGWYKSKNVELNLLNNFQGWNGDLVGVANYQEAGGSKIVLKLEAGLTDYYVSFNRKIGINSATQEGQDQVLLHTRAYNNGDSENSSLIQKLDAGDSYTISLDDRDFVVKVKEIDLVSTPAYASVSIEALVDCAIVAEGTYKIRNRWSTKLLKVKDDSLSKASIVQGPDDKSLGTFWRLRNVGSTFYEITSENSGMEINVPRGSTADGVGLMAWPVFHDRFNTDFCFSPNGSSSYNIIARHSSKSFDVARIADDTPVVQNSWSSGTNQQWELIPTVFPGHAVLTQVPTPPPTPVPTPPLTPSPTDPTDNVLKLSNEKCINSVVGFNLIDSETNKAISRLRTYIDHSILYRRSFNFKALQKPCDGSRIRSMQLVQPNGRVICDRRAPYSVFGDQLGDYRGKQFKLGGPYNISATPYESRDCTGPPGKTLTQEFSVTGAGRHMSCPGAIVYFEWINTDTKETLGPMKSSFDECVPSSNMTIQAVNVDCDGIQRIFSTKFSLSGGGKDDYEFIDEGVDFMLFGGEATDAVGNEWASGSYEISATPFSRRRGLGILGGSMSLAFNLRDC